MGRLALEVADIFREHGPAWREAQRDHLSLAQLKVMSTVTQCRDAALGDGRLRVVFVDRFRPSPSCFMAMIVAWAGRSRYADRPEVLRSFPRASSGALTRCDYLDLHCTSLGSKKYARLEVHFEATK